MSLFLTEAAAAGYRSLKCTIVNEDDFIFTPSLWPDDDFLLTIQDLRGNPQMLSEAKSQADDLLDSCTVLKNEKSLMDRFVSLKRNAWADSTLWGYKTGLVAYLLFCNFYNLAPFPLSDQIFGLFVAFLSLSFKSPDSISNYVSGVKSIYKFVYNIEYGPPGPHYTLALQGFQRLQQHRVSPVDALLPVDLKIMLAYFQCLGSRAQAFWAAILIVFYTFFRCSTLMPRSKCTSGGHLTRGDIKVDGNNLLVSLQYSKTRQFNDSLVLFPIPRRQNSPFCAFTAWTGLLASIPLPDTAPAFSWSHDTFYYYNFF
jgi:hypothetical protein